MMKGFSRILLAIALLAMPLTVFAQDDDVQVIVSEDDMTTLSLPAEWVAAEVFDAGVPSFVFANSEELLDVIMDQESTEEALEAGQIGGQMMLLPLDMLIMSGLDLPDDATAEEIALILIDLLYGDDEDTEEIGEPAVVEVDEGVDVVIFPVTNEDEAKAGIALIYEVSDGVFAVTAASAYIDDYDEDLEALFIEMVASIEYAGTADDLMMAILSAMSETE